MLSLLASRRLLADDTVNPHPVSRGLALMCFFATYTRMTDEDDFPTETLLENEEEIDEDEPLSDADEKDRW